MNKKSVSILLTSKPNYDEFAFKYFLLSLNQIQNYYEFIFPEVHNNYYIGERYDRDALFNLFEKKVRSEIQRYSETKPDYLINVITPSFGPNLFFECRGNLAFITTNTWEKYFSPPSLFEYLLHCIIACLLIMNGSMDLSPHRDTKGCCLDYTYFKMNRRVDISLGYICDKCKERIINGMSKEYLAEIMRIISRKWLGNVNDFGSVAYNLKIFLNLI